MARQNFPAPLKVEQTLSQRYENVDQLLKERIDSDKLTMLRRQAYFPLRLDRTLKGGCRSRKHAEANE